MTLPLPLLLLHFYTSALLHLHFYFFALLLLVELHFLYPASSSIFKRAILLWATASFLRYA